MKDGLKVTFEVEELYELKYAIGKELSWKKNQLQMMNAGMAGNAKLPEELAEKEADREKWLQQRVELLKTSLEKVKNLIYITKKEKENAKKG